MSPDGGTVFSYQQRWKKLREGKPILFRTTRPLRLGDGPYA